MNAREQGDEDKQNWGETVRHFQNSRAKVLPIHNAAHARDSRSEVCTMLYHHEHVPTNLNTMVHSCVFLTHSRHFRNLEPLSCQRSAQEQKPRGGTTLAGDRIFSRFSKAFGTEARIVVVLATQKALCCPEFQRDWQWNRTNWPPNDSWQAFALALGCRGGNDARTDRPVAVDKQLKTLGRRDGGGFAGPVAARALKKQGSPGGHHFR